MEKTIENRLAQLDALLDEFSAELDRKQEISECYSRIYPFLPKLDKIIESSERFRKNREEAYDIAAETLDAITDYDKSVLKEIPHSIK